MFVNQAIAEAVSRLATASYVLVKANHSNFLETYSKLWLKLICDLESSATEGKR
jgi:hypothetical protein